MITFLTVTIPFLKIMIIGTQQTMAAIILDGKALSQQYRAELTEAVNQLGRSPGLAVILIGDDPASQIYVNTKQKACASVGITSYPYQLPNTISQTALLELIQELNEDPKIHGILLQLPLPKQINTDAMLLAINPLKDVDGFHPLNLGKLAQNHPTLRPCTPYGIMKLFEAYKIDIKGKDTVIIGTSNIVGRPMALEMLNAGATITICHRATKDLKQHVKQAEILISAAGQPHLIKGDWIKPGAAVIDVGINRLPNGTIIGDVEFEIALQHAAWITPVPGGVGPMTVTMLLQNTITAYNMQIT